MVYRQEDSTRIDFPALGEALHSLNLGTVDMKRLSQKRGETEFLTNLITEELNGRGHPDAVIFAGPKVLLDSGVPQESLRKVADVEYPLFYMNYNVDPQSVPWRDAIGNAVKYLKGVEYTISRPRDLWNAWGDIMSRIVKLKIEQTRGNGRGFAIAHAGLYPLYDGASGFGQRDVLLFPGIQQREPGALYPQSPRKWSTRCWSAARVKPGELVYDLGSGDGRIVITAAQ